MIKLAKPSISQHAIEAVVAVLQSGNLIQGEQVHAFEEALQTYLGVKHAIVVSNGTAALHLALLALQIKPGDEVIVPAFTFPATANVVELVGARPVFVDITLEDFCMDAAKIEAAITPKTRAIMPVHEFGQSADMGSIMAIAAKFGLDVIEDAACALGTEYQQQKVGTFGKMGCFSFHPRKAITTGEGGAIITNDDELADTLRILRNHGLKYQDGRLDIVCAGFNYRLTEFQAALGLPQLAEIEQIIAHRRQLAATYDQTFAGLPWIKTPDTFAGRRMVYQTYHLLLDKTINRNQMIASLKDAGIETNFGAHALNCLSYYQAKYGYAEADFPNAVTAYRQGLALPMGSHIQPEMCAHIGESLKKHS